MGNVIVVGVDGGEAASRAARRAAELAAALGASLHVVTATSRASVEEFPDRPGTDLITSGEVAEAVASDVAEELEGVVTDITTGVLNAKPAAALVAEAERLDASLIVIGNRRAQGVSRVLGSVAASVAAHAPCDVYIVKTF